LAFPFVTEENFEGGTYASTHFDATNGTGQQVYGFRDLAAIPGAPAPYRGAYCFGFDISALSGANVYWQETGSWDMTAGTNDIYVRFALYVTDNIVMANTDEMILLHFWSGANTGEACIALNYTTANGLRLGIGDTSTASQFQTFTTGEWHTVELFFDPAGAGAGTIDGWLDGVAYTQVTGTHSDITSGVLGAIGVDAGTTTGHVFFDDLVTDDAQVCRQYRERLRHGQRWHKRCHQHLGGAEEYSCQGNGYTSHATDHNQEWCIREHVGHKSESACCAWKSGCLGLRCGCIGVRMEE
jgi:hypothetical protein